MLKEKLLPRLLPFVAYLVCTYLVLRDPYDLAGLEFSGGRLTGRLLDLHFAGIFLFAGAALLALVSPRISSIAAIVACLLSLPLYFYFIVPGLFRQVFAGDWSEPLLSYFVANRWAIEGIVTLVLAASLSIYILQSVGKGNVRRQSELDGETKAPPASAV